MSLELPTALVKATSINPRHLLLYGAPKVGKTTVAAEFSIANNYLLVDLEDGSSYVDALKVNVNSLKEVVELIDLLVENNRPYNGLIIDTGTKLEEFAEEGAAIMFSKSTLGKNFNRETDLVLDLPKGQGYKWLRQSFGNLMNMLSDAGNGNLIILCHVRDKDLVDKDGNLITQLGVTASNIDLTGKLRSITSSKADGIGYMYRRTNKDKSSELWVNFQTPDNDAQIMGGRAKHILGKNIKFSWSDIYLPENANAINN